MRALFDYGYEDYGLRVPRKPNDLIGLSGLGGIGQGFSGLSLQNILSTATGRANMFLSYAGASDPYGNISEEKFFKAYGARNLKTNTANTKTYLSVLHNRLRILGVRKDLDVPQILDGIMSAQVVEALKYMGYIADPSVTHIEWAAINYAVILRNTKGYDPIAPIPAVQTTTPTGAVATASATLTPVASASALPTTGVSWTDYFASLQNLLLGKAQTAFTAAVTSTTEKLIGQLPAKSPSEQAAATKTAPPPTPTPAPTSQQQPQSQSGMSGATIALLVVGGSLALAVVAKMAAGRRR